MRLIAAIVVLFDAAVALLAFACGVDLLALAPWTFAGNALALAVMCAEGFLERRRLGRYLSRARSVLRRPSDVQ